MTPVPPLIEQVRSRELLSDSVRRQLLGAILDGTLVAGERLHDDELIAWLGVSRTPIRTALERLSEIGLVEMEPNRFTRVATPSTASLVQALQVCAALVVSSAEGFVSCLDDADVDEFRRRLEPIARIGSHRDAPPRGAPARDAVARGTAARAGGDRSRLRCWQRDDLDHVDRLLRFFSRHSDNSLLLALLYEVRVRIAFSCLYVGVAIDRELVAEFADEILRGVENRDETVVTRALTEFLSARMLGALETHQGRRDASTVGTGG